MASRGEPFRANPASPPQSKRLTTQIFLRAMASIDVHRTMLARVRQESGLLVCLDAAGVAQAQVSLTRPPVVIAVGKAAARMSSALHEILGGKIRAGLVVAPASPAVRLEGFRYVLGGHPYPNPGSLQGAEAAMDSLSGLDERDLVVFLVSGGGSAIFEKPLDPAVTLADLVDFNKVLVTCGLPIEQINVLRKHVSAVKGGRLALRACPAQQLTIYISDVPEHLDSMVASGPTMPDPSTVDECYMIASTHSLAGKLPASIRRHFEARSLEETPKPGDTGFDRSHCFRLLSNHDVVEAGRAAAEKLGFTTGIDRGPWDDDFRQVADANSAALDELAARNPGRPVCLIVGGEVTCPVTGRGAGGRNQAFVLYAAGLIAGRNRAVLSAGTDGRDGNSPATGAVADGQTLSRAQAHGLDPERYLADSDSYHFFRTLGDTLEIGYTENNVRDLRLWLDL